MYSRRLIWLMAESLHPGGGGPPQSRVTPTCSVRHPGRRVGWQQTVDERSARENDVTGGQPDGPRPAVAHGGEPAATYLEHGRPPFDDLHLVAGVGEAPSRAQRVAVEAPRRCRVLPLRCRR